MGLEKGAEFVRDNMSPLEHTGVGANKIATLQRLDGLTDPPRMTEEEGIAAFNRAFECPDFLAALQPKKAG